MKLFSKIINLSALFTFYWFCLVKAIPFQLSREFDVNPGFQTQITQKGLTYLVNVGIPILIKELGSIKIEDISGEYHSPIGTIHYEVTNIVFQDLKIPKASLTSTSKGLLVSASGLSLLGQAHWHYKTHVIFPISDSGSLTLTISDTTLTLTLVFSKDSTGHLKVSSTGCKFNIGHLDVHFHGGASWLYNLFDSTIADSVKGSLNGVVCKQATNAIDTQVNKAIESLPVVVNIDKTSKIDYSLVNNPQFTPSYFRTDHKGEFYARVNPQEAPFSPAPIPELSSYNKMLYIWLTAYVVNTAGFVYQRAGVLEVRVTPDQVPSSVPIKLNTDSFKDIIPALYNKYPDMNMTLFLNATKPPVFVVTPKLGNLTGFGVVEVSVYDKNNNNRVTPVFNLTTDVYLGAKAIIIERNGKPYITGNTSYLGARFSLKDSNIGNFNPIVLNDAIKFLCTDFIIPIVNKYLNVGLEIPIVEGVSLINPTIQFGNGYILVDSDVNYKPS